MTDLNMVEPNPEPNDAGSKKCPSCGNSSESWAHVCPSCGHEFEQDWPPSNTPLWNPMAAAWWSLLLSPLFAAILLDHNWRSIGNRRKALWSRALTVVSAGALAAGLVCAMVPTLPATDKLITGVGKIVGVILTAACFSIARSQRQFLAGPDCPHHEKRRWGKPIALGAMGLASYLGLIIAIAVFSPPDVSLVESETSRVMTDFFKNEPQRGVTGVSSVKIHHFQGHDYIGTADVQLKDQRVPVDLKVHLENGQLQWSAQPHSQLPASSPSN